jgi:hypothetical protein
MSDDNRAILKPRYSSRGAHPYDIERLVDVDLIAFNSVYGEYDASEEGERKLALLARLLGQLLGGRRQRRNHVDRFDLLSAAGILRPPRHRFRRLGDNHRDPQGDAERREERLGLNPG